MWFLYFLFLQFLFSISIFFFCWSSKKSWDRAGGILVFKVTFLLYLFLIFSSLFLPIYSIYLRVIMFEARGLWGLLICNLMHTPYSVREWCRFLTKLSRLLSKTDCFQPVSFGTPCNPQFRCRGVSIINFACVMTDSRPLKNSQTAAEGLQSSIFVLKLCLLAEMNP